MINLQAPFDVDRCFKRLALKNPGKSYKFVDSDGTVYIYQWIPGDRTFYIETIETEKKEKRVPLPPDAYELFETGNVKHEV
jgi:hypothetical protein